jgi:hypothetical protein
MGKLEVARSLQETHESRMKAEKTLAVCQISGVYMSSTDNEQRTHDHLNGKQYLGWKSIRAKLEQLRAQKPPKGSGGGGGGGGGGRDVQVGVPAVSTCSGFNAHVAPTPDVAGCPLHTNEQACIRPSQREQYVCRVAGAHSDWSNQCASHQRSAAVQALRQKKKHRRKHTGRCFGRTSQLMILGLTRRRCVWGGACAALGR